MINEEYSAEQMREIGKALFFNSNDDSEKKNYGLKLILRAHACEDPEATFLVARLLLDGVLRSSSGNREDSALRLMCTAANEGCIQARAFLNKYCAQRYTEDIEEHIPEVPDGALVDFDGKPIKINRTGVFTPIDAVLEYVDGKNILTLSVNVMFLSGEEIRDAEEFERAVLSGLMSWQGVYEVFGGQKLFVRVNITNDDNLFDNLMIVPITDEVGETIRNITTAIGTKERKEQMADVMNKKRSFATNGFKWSVNSRKIIGIQSESGRFDDYEEIRHVAKHEFGHALGLGDLYASTVDSLGGVKKGTFPELDSYAISDKYYNLVMCDHHGPVSNNDIEMVVLAFRENKMQLYQPGKLKGKISYALGKGN